MSEDKKEVQEEVVTEQAPQQAAQEQVKTLFGLIQYKTDDDLDSFISGLSKRDALVVLVSNARHTIATGCRPEEAEVLSKAMRVLQKPDPKVEEKTDAEQPDVSEDTEKQG